MRATAGGRTRSVISLAASLCAVLMLALVAGCSGNKNGKQRQAIDFANIQSVDQLAHSSDLLVHGTIGARTGTTVIDPDLAIHYVLKELKVDRVDAVKAGTTASSPGSTVAAAFNVLNPEKRDSITNFDDLAKSGYPAEADIPADGTTGYLFMEYSTIGESDTKGYDVSGVAAVDSSADNELVFGYTYGDLKSSRVTAKELTSAKILSAVRSTNSN